MSSSKWQDFSSVVKCYFNKWNAEVLSSKCPHFLGRDEEIHSINKWLLEEHGTTNNYGSFKVLCLIGIAGVGKTTLAQYVYMDERVTTYFDHKLWLHAPEDLDNQPTLEKQLKCQKLLIVLDDVREEDNEKLIEFYSTLTCVARGSKIVVTTRSETIRKSIVGLTYIERMKPLQKDDFWKLFTHYAFCERNPEDYPKLQIIGRLICDELSGLPLAAKCVGALLNEDLETKHWRAVLESGAWRQNNSKRDMQDLKLIYDSLPDCLKTCFSYFALFPKHQILDTERLVRIWMAQGFVEFDTNQMPEDVGMDYIDKLCQEGFLDRVGGQGADIKIPVLMYDLAEFVSAEKCLRVEGKDIRSIPETVCHLYMTANNLLKFSNPQLHQIKQLQSLIIDAEPGFDLSLSLFQIFNVLLELRVLILPKLSKVDVPANIDRLVNLRYLEICDSIYISLPESLCKLVKLECLELGQSFLMLPNGINKLTKLRYLNADPEVICSITDIGKLISLQRLTFYQVKNNSAFPKIDQLSKINQIRGKLTIKVVEDLQPIQEFKSPQTYNKLKEDKSEQDSNFILNNKVLLSELELIWDTESDKKCMHPEINIDILKPPEMLKELSIIGYKGSKYPEWLKSSWLPCLRILHLSHCLHWKELEYFGELPSLVVLSLESMKSVQELNMNFYESNLLVFPKLVSLAFSNMKGWEKWHQVKQDIIVFPRLQKLQLKHCQNLQGPLPLPDSLKGVVVLLTKDFSKQTQDDQSSSKVISVDNISLLIQWLPDDHVGSINKLEFDYYPYLENFTVEQEQWFLKLASLEHLSFIDCYDLKSLPESMQELASLQVLIIEGCPHINSLPEGLPANLKSLHIARCEALKVPYNGPNWSMISYISSITIDGEEVNQKLEKTIDSSSDIGVHHQETKELHRIHTEKNGDNNDFGMIFIIPILFIFTMIIYHYMEVGDKRLYNLLKRLLMSPFTRFYQIMVGEENFDKWTWEKPT